MKKVKNPSFLFKGLLYLSIPFVVYYLLKFDYLSLSKLTINYTWLSISILLLWLGFIGSALSWGYALKVHGIKVSKNTAIVSHGLAVFAKYIPGKIWVILGRASYVSKQGYALKDTSLVSLKEQLLYLVLGLLISFVPSLNLFGPDLRSLFIFLTIIGLTLILFSYKIHNFFNAITLKILKKSLEIPVLSIRKSAKLSIYILTYWILWIIAFYCFARSILPYTHPLTGFAFPLSVCYGVLALIIPGGIGVREGIIVAFLTANGLALELAITLSVCARLWFISGEIFIFIFSIVMQGNRIYKSPEQQ